MRALYRCLIRQPCGHLLVFHSPSALCFYRLGGHAHGDRLAFTKAQHKAINQQKTLNNRGNRGLCLNQLAYNAVFAFDAIYFLEDVYGRANLS